MSVRRIFIADGRVRSGWRILIFAGFYLTAEMLLYPLAAAVFPPRWLYAPFFVGLLAALAAGWLTLYWVEGRGPGELGFALERRAWRDAGVGLGIGAGGLLLAAGLLAIAGALRYRPDDGGLSALAATLAVDFTLFGVAAAAEEALFRGYAFQALVQGIGAWPATLLASAGFAAMHAANPQVDAFALANIFLAGVMLSLAYLRTRSLWFATAVHLGWNWTQASLLDLPVSGIELDTPMYEPAVFGASWFTGSGFGPEGGVVGTVAIFAMLFAVKWLGQGRGQGQGEGEGEVKGAGGDG